MHGSQGAFKLVATAIIWGVVLLLLGSALWVPVFSDNAVSGGIIIPMMVILGIVATISTGVVWTSDNQRPPMMQGDMEKAKRMQGDPRSRLMQTLGALDDDEAAAMLDDLKARLHGGDSDGEISAVEMLRQERRRRD
jgi:hypothetical protein